MRRDPGPVRPLLAAVLAAVLFLALPSRAPAHEIPTNVTVHAFVKPEGERMRLLVRVPLASMRDVVFPVQGPGYLDVERATPLLADLATLWISDYIEVYEGGTRLRGERVAATRISLPSDRSFAEYATALAHTLSGPTLTSASQLVLEQAMLDVLFEYPIASEHSELALNPFLAHLGIRTATVLRFLPPGGSERVLQYLGDPGLVRLDPRWHQAALSFVKLGFLHILEGIDHLLFVLCLVIPFRRFRPLVAVVTSFTVAHSITLMAAAFGLAPSALWFPPLIETLIALSIVYMAFENIAGAGLQRRWMVAFGFGLVHGFGFSFLLTESLQFAGSHLFASLLAFNVGVELGQLLVLLLLIPLLGLLFRHVVAEKVGVILLSALVAHTAWHWMTDRGAELAEHQFARPALDALMVASLMRWAMLALIVGGIVWAMHGVFGRMLQPGREAGAAPKLEG
jgi:hypothetical protein